MLSGGQAGAAGWQAADSKVNSNRSKPSLILIECRCSVIK